MDGQLSGANSVTNEAAGPRRTRTKGSGTAH
jgi:hypothetical protein